MKTIGVNGVELAVHDEGAGPPVLLVHGFPLDHTIWDGQIAALKARCRVIAPDLRGFGRSGVTPGEVTMVQFAADLAALLDAMGIGEPVVLAGLSMGGYIAFPFYQQYRARVGALVLCDTRAGADTPAAAAARRETAARVERDGPQVLAESMLPKMFAPVTYEARPHLVQFLRDMILRGNPQGQAAAARGMAERPDFTAILAGIDCPTLLIVGREDAISPPAEMRGIAAAIPGARLVEIPDAGHMAPLEKPAEVSAAIRECVAGH